MIGPPPGRPVAADGAECLLLLVDGRVLRGRVLGILGDTVRFRSDPPVRGPVLLPFAEAEPLSLHDGLRTCRIPLDADAFLLLAGAAAARGLVDLALRDLDRAAGASAGREAEIAATRERILVAAAGRALEEAREHMAAGRPDHARAALDEVLRRFPESEPANEARRMRRDLVAGAA